MVLLVLASRPSLLLLLVLAVVASVSGGAGGGGGGEKTYIVRTDADAKPSVFPTHAHWYESVVLAASGGREWPEGGPLIHTYSAAFHGFSARMSPAAAAALAGAPGVAAVVPERVRRLATTRSPRFLGLLSSPPSALLADSDFGADLVIAIIDTGISPTHRSFHDQGLGPVPPKWRGVCASGPGFPPNSCNRKLVGARFFSAGYEATSGRMNETAEVRSPLDTDGHGTHTASIAAGRYVFPASTLGYARGVAAGMAPKARLAAYKVCWVGGCFDSDILAAFDAAVADGVHVVSLSVGGVIVPYYPTPPAPPPRDWISGLVVRKEDLCCCRGASSIDRSIVRPLARRSVGMSMAAKEEPAAKAGGAAMGGEEAVARAAQKRYEGLLTVRAKAVKGKGAWYWAHLEPVLIPAADTGMPPKAVKLRCALCSAVFSASNPSRTASEHLKRGTCPNFSAPPPGAGASGSQHQQQTPQATAQALPPNSTASSPIPISSIAPSSPHHHHSHPHHYQSQPQRQQQHHQHHSGSRKRHSMPPAYTAAEPVSHHHHLVVVDPSSVYSPTPLALPPPPPPPQAQSALVLSGGKEDLGALAMLEDSVKRLKSPKASPGAMLPKQQADAALALLADWFLESSGGVSLSAAGHPKLRAFLRHVGLPDLQRTDLVGPRLDARFAEARADATARVRDALFFQLAADGWREQVATLSVNLPNGTSVFHRAVPVPSPAPSDFAEESLLDAVASVSASGSSNDLQHCAGIVADRFKSKALRDLENKHHWMVNLSCQIHGFTRLVRDLARELPLFRSAAAKSAKLAAYFNAKATVRCLLHKHQIQELGHASLLRVALVPFNGSGSDFRAAFEMLDDVLTSAHALQLAVLEESYKLVCIDDPAAREMGEMVQNVAFWTEVEAVHSLVKLIMDMVKDMEADRPLVGQCLPLWKELRGKVRDWCDKFNIDEGSALNVVEKRFRKNYHPAWSAAFILDPLYLVKDASGRYLPPFQCLTPDQEKDVDRLITRMVSREEAHLALMELMKWRSDGLDPLYAQAVQVRQPDPSTGKMKVANKQSSRLVWETCLSELKSLGKVAVRLIFLHATARGFRCTPSMVRWLSAPGSLAGGIDRAHRLVFVAANSKLERRDFTSDEDKDAELLTEGEDDVLNEPGIVEPPSV